MTLKLRDRLVVGHRSLEPSTVVRIHVSQPIIKNKNMKTVAVGMSGGVDSTMAAYLLKKQGYNVIGLTMSIYDDNMNIPYSEANGCYGPRGKESLKDAKIACDKLGIEHHMINLEKEFKTNVVDYFCNTYLDGHTPNPCVICNTKIKFGAMLDVAKNSGIKFDYFATGHYVRIEKNEENGRLYIRKPVDSHKDQTYFLYRLTQDQLSHLIFPISEYVKTDLKKIAEKVGFKEYADKKESQDFIEADNYSILFGNREIKPGDIVDINGKKIAEHNGIINYTIGQRKGLNLGGGKEAMFVVDINPDLNIVIVGPKEYLYCKGLIAVDLNWMYIEKLEGEMKVECKVRSSNDTIPCVIKMKNDNEVEVIFDAPQTAVKPGQSVVFYDNDKLIGGGIIAKKIK